MFDKRFCKKDFANLGYLPASFPPEVRQSMHRNAIVIMSKIL